MSMRDPSLFLVDMLEAIEKDVEIVWTIASQRLSELRPVLQKMLADLSRQRGE